MKWNSPSVHPSSPKKLLSGCNIVFRSGDNHLIKMAVMFTQISWNSYFIIVGLLSVVYYLFIAWIYYRSDVIKLISGRRVSNRNFIDGQINQTLLQSFSDEIRAFISEASKDHLDIRSLMASLQLLIRKFPGIRDMTLKKSIQNLIIHECETNCSIHLSEEELRELWN